MQQVGGRSGADAYISARGEHHLSGIVFAKHNLPAFGTVEVGVDGVPEQGIVCTTGEGVSSEADAAKGAAASRVADHSGGSTGDRNSSAGIHRAFQENRAAT